MELIQELRLKNGQVLVSVNGYSGEDDFYLMYKVIEDVLAPEHITYGVDSMCVDGSFRKDGVLVRMSSECVTDQCCFHYDPTAMRAEEIDKVKEWLNTVVAELHRRKPV